MISPYRWLIELVLALVAVGLVAFAWWHHGNARYHAGIAAQQSADNRSFAVLDKAVRKIDADRAAKVAKLEKEDADAQKRYDDYVARDPLGPVRVLVDTYYREAPVPGPAAGIAPPGPPAAASRPRGPVHPGNPALQSLDLAPALGVVLHGFADLDLGLRECEGRAMIDRRDRFK